MPPRATHRPPRHRRGLSVLVLLALALRALIPTGYMITAVEGHAQLALCPSGLHWAGHLHHEVDHGAGITHGADHCPYALAGGHGLAGAAPEPAQPYFVLLRPAYAVAPASVPAEPPLRHHAPRGPPSLA
jgi:hypothetical protein